MRKAVGKMGGQGRMKLWIVLAGAVIGVGFSPAMAGDEKGKQPPKPKQNREDDFRWRSGMRGPLGPGQGGRSPRPGLPGEPPREPGEFDELNGPEVTEAEIEEFLEMLSETLPNRYEKLSGIREKRPEAFRMMIRQRGSMMRQVLGAKRRSPVLAGLLLREHFIEEQLGELERRHRETSKMEKPGIEKEVQLILGDLFDVKMERQTLEIAQLEERLGKHKEMLEARKKNKDEILKREFERRFRPELSLE
jgi:hypothetical protein